MKRVLSVLMLVTFGLSCKEAPPQPPDKKPDNTPKIALSIVDIGVTEAILKVQLLDSSLDRGFTLMRDSQILLFVPSHAPSDTILYDETLAPSQTYNYRVYCIDRGNIVDSAGPKQLRTLDTTSHKFVWQMDRLGVSGSSILYDIAIINDTLAFSVGELHLKDSTGQFDPTLYNLTVWNGTSWSVARLNYQGIPPSLSFICAINDHDVWIDPWFHWDGTNFHEVPLNPTFIGVHWNRMWGSDSGTLYVVGNSGMLAHSSDHGSTWQLLTTGTTLNLYDIWGSRDPATGRNAVLCIASYLSQDRGNSVFSIDGSSVTALSTNGLASAEEGLWFAPNKKYLIVGQGIHSKRSLSDSAWTRYPPGQVTRYSSTSVRGTDVNNIFIVGSFGEVVHFNGVSWHNYAGELPLPPATTYSSVAVYGRQVMAVGFDNTSGAAVVLRGVRQP